MMEYSINDWRGQIERQSSMTQIIKGKTKTTQVHVYTNIYQNHRLIPFSSQWHDDPMHLRQHITGLVELY